MLESGDVFLIRDFRNTGYDPHYQIVVHKTASNDLVIVYPSTQIEKVKRRCLRDSRNPSASDAPVTYVEIPRHVCASLPSLCAVNCDKAFLSTELERESGMDFIKADHKLGDTFLELIRAGIRDSRIVQQIVIDALSR
ncbi:MAG TPA: hypothetical protein DCP63_04290 [Bacteroidetes bacterium]|nr:hypothetical protein [Bacteroidota bacterium]